MREPCLNAGTDSNVAAADRRDAGPPAVTPAPPAPPGLAWRALRYARRRAVAAGGAAAAALARARDERRAARMAKLRALALADPAAALDRVTRARRLRGARFLAEAEALLAVRVHGWRAAAPRFAALPPPDGGPSAAELLRAGPGPGLDLVLPVRRPGALPRAEAGRIVVATARFGDGPLPAPPFQELPGLRFLLLTDRDLAVPGWETVRVPAPDPDPARAMLLARIRGAELLAGLVPEAGASLWVEPELRLVGSLDTLLARWLAPQALALWRHPRARGWREAVEDGLLAGAAPGPLVELAEACEAAGLPEGPACDTRAVWRRHGDPGVAALMAAWAARRHARHRRRRLRRAAGRCRTRRPAPRILPAALGGLDDGLVLAAAPWPAPPPRPGRPPPPPGGCRSPSSTPRSSPPPPRPSCAAASSPSWWPSTCPTAATSPGPATSRAPATGWWWCSRGCCRPAAPRSSRACATATSPSSAPGTT